MSNPARSRDSNSRLVHSNGDLFFTGVAGFGLSVLALIASRWSGVAACGVFFAGSLVLAEFAARSRRMAVSSTLLFLTYLWSIHYALDHASDLLQVQFPEDDQAPSFTLNDLAAPAFLAATWLYWVRYRVPAAAGASLVIVIWLLTSLQLMLFESLGWERVLFLPLGVFVSLAAGIALLAIATLLDLRDPKRHTIYSDIAQWLHMVAAFFVVGLVIWVLTGSSSSNRFDYPMSWHGLESIFLLINFVLLSVFSLAINLSAYFAFSCLYFVFLYPTVLIYVLPDSFALILVFFISCGFFVGLLLTWHTARSRVLKCLPARIRARLPAIDQPFALSFLIDPRTCRAGKSGHSG